jgi:iron complex outermembrane receptor protein
MNKNIKISLLLASLLSSLYAQDTFTLEPLTIDSTAIKTDELKSTDAVEVYTAADIEKAHVQNVYEFLGKESSVFATSAYGNPFLQKLDLRGYGVNDGYQNIVVTLNGRKMNNVDMTPQLLASIAPDSIEKIEIIKSSGIVAAGDGANGGVINITTKKSDEKEISFYGGTYGTADGSFYFGSHTDKLSICVNGEVQKNDGIRDIDNNGKKDQNKFSTFGTNISYNPTKEVEIHLNASTTNTDVTYAGTMTEAEYKQNPSQQGTVDYGWGPLASSSTHQTYRSDAIALGGTYFINENLSFNLDLANENKQSNYITYGSIYDSHYKSAKLSLEYVNDFYSSIIGFDKYDGNFVKKSSTFDATKQNQAIYIMNQFRLDHLTLKAGYRYETVNFNMKNNENKSDSLHGVELGINYLLDNANSVFANYSRSYESASLDRLFSFFTSSYTGYVNPAKANNFEIGYNNIQKNNKLKISTYYIDLQDEIYYYAGVNYVGAKNTNINKSHKYGLDFYDKYLINDKFNAALNYNYVKAIIDKEVNGVNDYSGKELPGVSNHNIKATLSYLPNEHTNLSLTEMYRSQAYAADDFANNFAQKQDAYITTDISATYAKKSWEIFAKINNLFNQKNGLWTQDNAIYPVNYTTTSIAGFKLKY